MWTHRCTRRHARTEYRHYNCKQKNIILTIKTLLAFLTTLKNQRKFTPKPKSKPKLKFVKLAANFGMVVECAAKSILEELKTCTSLDDFFSSFFT